MSPEKADSKSSSPSRKRHKHKHHPDKQGHSKDLQNLEDEGPSEAGKKTKKDVKPQSLPSSPHRTRQQTLKQRSQEDEASQGEAQGPGDTGGSQDEAKDTSKDESFEVTDRVTQHETKSGEPDSETSAVQPQDKHPATTTQATPATSNQSPPHADLVNNDKKNNTDVNVCTSGEDDGYLSTSEPETNNNKDAADGAKSQEREGNGPLQENEADCRLQDSMDASMVVNSVDTSGVATNSDKADADVAPVGGGPNDETNHNLTHENDHEEHIHDDHANDDFSINFNVDHLIRLETSRQLEAAWSAQRRLVGAFVSKVQQGKLQLEQQ